MNKYIWIKGKRYYYYSSHNTWRDARNLGLRLKRKNNKCQYFILTVEKGVIVPYKTYRLYTTKFSTLSLW